MKKSIPVRVLTALGGLTLLALAAGAVAEGFFRVPVTAALGGLLAAGGALAVLGRIVAALALTALAAAAVVCALPARQPRQTGSIMQKGENGAIGITVKAIEKMVLACAEKHAEITSAEVDVREVREGIVILMNVEQVGGVSIPLSVARLQKQVRQYVNGRTGLDVVEVRVMVDNQSDAHVASEFEVEDTVVPSAPVHAGDYAPHSAAPLEQPLAEQLRQIAEITQHTLEEAVHEPEPDPISGLPIPQAEETDLDALLQEAEVAPEIIDDEEKPLHQRVFGAEEMPLTVPMPPEMTAEPAAEEPAVEEPAVEAAQETAEAQPFHPEEAAEDWTDPSLQAAAEEVLTGDAQEDPAEAAEEPAAEESADAEESAEEEIPMPLM